LEVFDPNAPVDLSPEQVPAFINDMIARTLAGVAQAGRPVFLKIVYHGPRAMEELVAYDPHLVVGILGGAAGTTYDAFKLLAEAKKYGARAALYGRKINNAECQLAFIEFLRLIIDGAISPEDAVRAYHGVLQRLKIRPQRSLEDDLVLQTGVMSYGGKPMVTVPAKPSALKKSAASAPPAHSCACGGPDPHQCHCHDHDKTGDHQPNQSVAATDKPPPPDFSRLTPAEKLAFNRARLDRIFGGGSSRQ